jgi:hypothetical protein
MATCGEHERQLCPLKLIPVHVSGHQDKEKSWDSLSWLEQLNCEADRHAKLALNAQVPPLTDRSLTGNHCALMIQGKIIIMNQRERERVPLYHYIHKQEALDYWKKTDKVGADVSVINWASIGRLNRNTPPPLYHCAGFLPKPPEECVGRNQTPLHVPNVGALKMPSMSGFAWQPLSALFGKGALEI